VPFDASLLIVLVHRLAAADRGAVARVSRRLHVPPLAAGALIGLADGSTTTAHRLQAELDLSPGGATALITQLERRALIAREPDPDRPGETRVRLACAAARELRLALEPLTARTAAATAPLAPPEQALAVEYLAALVRAVNGV